MEKPWLDRNLPVEERVAALLAAMTLEEKIGQLQQVANLDDEQSEAVRAGRIGSSLFSSGAWGGNVKDEGVHRETMRRMQALAVNESRLGIPILYARDVIHGYRTIFPIPLGQAASWSPELVEQAAAVAAREAAAEGLHWTFTPMLDVTREPRWGRIAEGCGEDPYLCAELAKAAVHGYQGDDLAAPDRIAACAKHYVAYGAAEGGRDYNTVDIGPRSLRDTYLPPFRAAVAAGVATVMSSFNDIDSVPVTANREVLTDILRGEFGFEGFVVSDWNAVGELIQHGVAADDGDAAAQALCAGVDMDMVSGCYDRALQARVEAGAVALETLDEAVRRVLRIKVRLGLFEQALSAFEGEPAPLLTAGDRALARRVARESMVLLKNDGVLPLGPETKRVLLTGPFAEADHQLFGTWTLDGRAEDVTPLAAALGAALPKGVELRVKPWSDEAVYHGRTVDVAVVAVGEHPCRSGEANSTVTLDLPAGQQQLLEALHACGTPIVAVVYAGRPLSIPWLAEHARAILYAWHPGVEGGTATADLLTGAAAPVGRLPVSLPRSVGQVPVYYNHRPTGRPVPERTRVHSRYADSPDIPLYPFGHGLGYTRFDYVDLSLSVTEVAATGTLTVAATVRNAGERAGTETAQLYVRDPVASVSRPVKELKGFQRVTLQPGESKRVVFTLHVADLAFTGLDMTRRVEPGAFDLWVGPDSTQGLHATFSVTAEGAVRAEGAES